MTVRSPFLFRCITSKTPSCVFRQKVVIYTCSKGRGGRAERCDPRESVRPVPDEPTARRSPTARYTGRGTPGSAGSWLKCAGNNRGASGTPGLVGWTQRGGALFGKNELELANGQANSRERATRHPLFFRVRLWMYYIQKYYLHIIVKCVTIMVPEEGTK